MHSTAIRIVSIVFGLMSLVVIGLNLLTDRAEFWAIWPIWAFAMIAGAVIVSLKMRHVPLGIWLGGGFCLVIGLVVIDLTDGNGWWAFWPAGAWIILSALFTALAVDLLAGIPTQSPRQPDER
ncbi:MAG: hypothetical protein H0T72_05815 [Chloroflexia bacterium]|jgi:hypothetical protein|nr:hypothetical protein [Chloroflexia bacterium]